jgi:hypothetical protein
VATQGGARFCFALPGNMASLESAWVVIIGKATAVTSYDLRLAVDGGGDGPTADAVEARDCPLATTANALQELEVTRIFAGRERQGAGGAARLCIWARNPEALYVVGLRLVCADRSRRAASGRDRLVAAPAIG